MSIVRLIILTLFLFGINSVACAQSDSTRVPKTDSLKSPFVDVDFTITVDDKISEDSLNSINIFDRVTKKRTNLWVRGVFVLELNYNTIYEVAIGRKNTNTKTIIIDTHAPRNNWYIQTGANLSIKEKGKKKIVGSISYDEATKTFVKKKAD